MQIKRKIIPSTLYLFIFYAVSFVPCSTENRHATENFVRGKEPDDSCTGLNNETGRCDYLRRCFYHEYDSNFTLAVIHSCTIGNAYMGICCSNRWNGMYKKDTENQSFAKVLPLIAVDRKEKRNEGRIVWSTEEEGASSSSRNPQVSRGCGTTLKNPSRLAGGRPADPTEWPWMVALLKKDKSQYCGGVLITDRHVLTAAHCVDGLKPRDVRVRLGEYDFESTEETRALDFSIVEISIHPDFDTATYENDIAMIKMHRPTIFDSYIWPVCLPPIGQSFENESAIVTGWGTRYYGGPASTVLMEVGVPVWPRDRCTRSFVQRIPNTTICAGSYEGGGDSCQGDSGGPLLHQLENGRWVNIGIVSWGIGCGNRGVPGIYTRVNFYFDWILKNAVF
ncbi:proclotting enzyme-like [Apis dorsata]|uniref:proclotting enzyme-like n=1 Tax=Apis dorsata TaxID=7462 RepID=UPI001293A238|nr:proclotting enzyme-like [Apis dorsata]